ncbi:MAG TPA: hypothetical protein EYP43_04310, partial [Thermoplasmata archaeon]|nr:hypothetical protein [Thermoplasmata archaeon]
MLTAIRRRWRWGSTSSAGRRDGHRRGSRRTARSASWRCDMAEDGGYRPEGIRLGTPLSRDAVRRLRTGDLVYLTGTVVTMRDRAHLRTMEEGPPTDLEGVVVYHCGPLARHDGRDWHVLAAGPTTSIRMESLAPVLLRAHRPRAIVGKGGMG